MVKGPYETRSDGFYFMENRQVMLYVACMHMHARMHAHRHTHTHHRQLKIFVFEGEKH